MIKKKLKIPLYFQNLTIIQTDDFESIHKFYNLKGQCGGYDAVTIDDGDNIVVVFNSKVDASTIAHESTHVCTYTFQKIGAEIDVDNDETFAYLIGWVVGQIHKIIKVNYERN
ncbi:MAG TPA: hypothetical protein VLA48_02980 [Nitrososphaeraceae archaeon]|nr:hypothetical protein [Nitrososphaeraceae archaeon]